MAPFSDYDAYDAVGLAALVQRGDVTPAEVLEAAIARALAVNPALNAIIAPLYGEACQAVAAGLPRGPLTGVPYLLKDLDATMAGVATSNGGRIWAPHIPVADTEYVARVRRAGLVVFGKTNTPELGLTVTTEPAAFGPTRNPWNLAHSSGGSSGGAAAAVAAGIVPAAHASDGGGSIRIPASACGLVGLKPTRGRIPLGPDIAESWAGMTVQHAVTRTVRDTAALLDATGGPLQGDPSIAPAPVRPYLEEVGRPPGMLRIGFSAASPLGGAVDPECQRAVEAAAALCASLGHRVEEEAPRYDVALFGKATTTIIRVSTRLQIAAAEALRGRPAEAHEVEPVTWRSAENGRTVTALDYVRATRDLHRLGRQFAAYFARHDVLLWPVLAAPPAELGVFAMNPDDMGAYVRRLLAYTPFCMVANVAGVPAIALPLHMSAAGLPVGVQFIGRFGAEDVLIRLAAQLETAHPWAGRRAPVAPSRPAPPHTVSL